MTSISVNIKAGDALSEAADVLVLKHAQGSFGLDDIIVTELRNARVPIQLPDVWDTWLVKSVPGLAKVSRLLFVGVPILGDFRYPEIRKFARQALATLATKLPQAQRVLLTVHGVGYGLDEAEAFGAEIAGLSDAVQDGDIPENLQEVTIIENHRGRARRLQQYIENLLPDGRISRTDPSKPEPKTETAEKLSSLGQASDAKAHVFVAMPFRDEMDDVYHYGIYSSVNAAGFICERADLSTFTGDILDWVKTRIRTASLVVADLTDANPNVYLEVGYAWGVGIPTVLVARSEEHLKFDVRGQRCLIYKKIKELEDLLTSELIALRLRT